jgi:beta-mannosidase
MEKLPLSDQWQVKPHTPDRAIDEDFADVQGWVKATVPGSVHLDLLAAGVIADPFYGLNEADLQWIGEADWLYRCLFTLPTDFEKAEAVDLCCDGLDTCATVWLNGTQILSSDNMFVPLRTRIEPLLHVGQNELRILFESAWRRGKEREAQYGVRALWNGDASRLYVRKAQYHYGWDWGPTFLTLGPWRVVRLEAYSVRVAELHCPAEVSDDLHSALLPIRILLESAQSVLPDNLDVRVSIFAPTGEVVAEATLPGMTQELQHTFTLQMPLLWWPRGYGEQALYRLEVTLLRGAEILAQHEEHLGLRRLRLVQQPVEDEAGTSFFFEINNTPLFCGGANWIPADSFLSRVTAERYQDWLQLAVDGNMSMLRVWGGGIYEEDVFYNLCDEMGLLVWQDFMFACGMYPAHSEFLQSVREEVRANVRRLRHHPSIVLWCGNNEDYILAESLGIDSSEVSGEAADDLTQTQFPARAIYEHLLPEVCKQLDPTRPYWPGSPYGGTSANDLQEGDQHIWNVWHGNMAPYQEYGRFAGRFVSEFGMEAFPNLNLFKSFVPANERYPQSQTLDFHNKAEGGPARLIHYLVENIRIPADLEGYIYATQFVQSEALATGIRSWRRCWRGPGREHTAGALVWQMNDCWPVISWAIVDYELRPKAAYYTVKRELAPFVVGLARYSQETVAAWVVNGTTNFMQAELEIRAWTMSGRLVSEQRRAIELAANRATEMGEIAVTNDKALVMGARLLKDGTVLARTTLWPEPFKYQDLPDPEIKIERLDAQTIRVAALRPAKGVWLTSGNGIRWSDNMLDILPGDPQVVIAQGLGESIVRVRTLR